MQVISLASFKGGTGKTLLTFNIASILASQYDKKVLVIDSDPQHNSTHLLTKGYDKGIEDIFHSDINNYDLSTTEVIQESTTSNIDIIPSSIRLIKTEAEATTVYAKELILKRWMDSNAAALNQYDYIFIDTNPTMSTVNINAFLVSDSIYLVTDIDADSVIAIDTFLDAYYPIQTKVRPNQANNVRGIIVNKLKETTNLDRDFIDYIESDSYPYRDLVVNDYIHEAVALRQTKATGKAISQADNERAYKEILGLIKTIGLGGQKW